VLFYDAPMQASETSIVIVYALVLIVRIVHAVFFMRIARLRDVYYDSLSFCVYLYQ
jgi:hypothetical protein